jgi:ribose transport system permease protein
MTLNSPGSASAAEDMPTGDDALALATADSPVGRIRSALPRRGTSVALLVIQLGPALVLLLLWVVMAFASPYFLTGANISNLLQATAVVAVVAIGQLLVILTGAIDLSAGAAIALCTVLGAKFAHGVTDSGVVVILVMLAVGAGVGIGNGLLVERAALGSPFVVTLGMLSIATGLSYVVSDGSTIVGMPSLVDTIGTDDLVGVPISSVVVLGVAAIAYALTTHMTWGRWIYAIGGNREAASRVGIPVRAVSASVFIFSGLSVGVAGVFSAGLTDSGAPSLGFNTELDAISAVVIGGATLMGGRGTVFGALVGALILGTIHNGLNLLSVNTNWEPIVLGAVLILALAMDQARRRLETRLRLLEARQQGDLAPSSLAEVE